MALHDRYIYIYTYYSDCFLRFLKDIYRKVRSASVLGSMVMFSAYKLQIVEPDLPQNVIPIAAFTPHKKNKLSNSLSHSTTMYQVIQSHLVIPQLEVT